MLLEAFPSNMPLLIIGICVCLDLGHLDILSQQSKKYKQRLSTCDMLYVNILAKWIDISPTYIDFPEIAGVPFPFQNATFWGVNGSVREVTSKT